MMLLVETLQDRKNNEGYSNINETENKVKWGMEKTGTVYVLLKPH